MQIRIALLVALLLPVEARAQASQPVERSRADIIAAARNIIRDARYCTFVTVGEDGHPQARIVDPLAPDVGFTIRIATNPLTRKVTEIRRDARATLLCFDAASSSYVTVLGRGALVADPAEKQRYWKQDWAPFYPNGARGDDFILIALTPIRLEIVSEARGMVGDPKTWLPIAIAFPPK